MHKKKEVVQREKKKHLNGKYWNGKAARLPARISGGLPGGSFSVKETPQVAFAPECFSRQFSFDLIRR
jgi:hypothetical protein